MLEKIVSLKEKVPVRKSEYWALSLAQGVKQPTSLPFRVSRENRMCLVSTL